MPKVTKEVKAMVEGVKVSIKGYGKGVITKVTTAESVDGNYDVFHVLLDNGDTRHFVGSLLEI